MTPSCPACGTIGTGNGKQACLIVDGGSRALPSECLRCHRFKLLVGAGLRPANGAAGAQRCRHPSTCTAERGSLTKLTHQSKRSEEHTSELQSRPHLVC